MQPYFKHFAKAYLDILKRQNSEVWKIKKEFFGLRDFYRYLGLNCIIKIMIIIIFSLSINFSMVKMLYWMCREARCRPNLKQIEHVVRRNFSGYEGFDPRQMLVDLPFSPPAPDKEKSMEEWKPRLREQFRGDKQAHSTLRAMFLQVNKERLRKEYIESDRKISEDKFMNQEFDKCLILETFSDEHFQICYQKEFNTYFKQAFEKVMHSFTVIIMSFFTTIILYGQIWPLIKPDCTPAGLIKASLANKERSYHG